MRCQAVKIAGGAKDKKLFNSLPPMFIANIDSENQCATVEGKNTIFPRPGKDKSGSGDGKPKGSNCYTAAEKKRIGKK